jgi:hypothetical protein
MTVRDCAHDFRCVGFPLALHGVAENAKFRKGQAAEWRCLPEKSRLRY